MSGTDWQISGEYMESCNCDYLCPCIYTNPQARGDVRPLHGGADLPHRQGAAWRHRSVGAVLRAGDPLRQDHGRRQLGVRRRGGRTRGHRAARGSVGHRQRRRRRTSRHDPQQPGERLPRRGVQADRIQDGGAEALGHRSPKSCRSRSRAWRRATAAASRSISTTRRIRPAGALPWRAPGSCMCTASGSISTWSARATTGISRHSPGRRRPRACAWRRRSLLRRERVVVSAGACRRDGDRLAVSVHRPPGHGHVDAGDGRTCPTWRCRSRHPGCSPCGG